MGQTIDVSEFSSPISYAETMLARAGSRYGIEFKELRLIEIERALLNHYAEVDFIPEPSGNQTPDSMSGYYVVSDRSGLEIAVLAQSNRSVAMMANIIVTSNLLANKPIPKYLLKVAIRRMWYGLVSDAFPPPKKGFPKSFILRFYVHLVALGVAEFYQLPLTRNDGSPEHSACDVVSEATENLGYVIPYTRLRDWCNHRDSKAFREASDVFSSIIDTGRFEVEGDADFKNRIVRG